MDELTSPDEFTHSKDVFRTSMPPPTSIPLPQPMLTPSQLIQPQLLTNM